MNIPKLACFGAAAAFLAAGLALAGGVQDQTVQITETGYSPALLDVSVGQKVIFHNATPRNHTVTSKPSADVAERSKDETAFDSGLIQPCGTWEFTFLKAGTFAYYCKEDRSLSGKILVSPSK